MPNASNTVIDIQTAEQKICAAILFNSNSEIEQLFDQVVDVLKRKDARLAGYLQREAKKGEGCCSTLFMENIANGDRTIFTQSLGAESTGCRLDPFALAELSKNLVSEIDDNTEMLILNRFGKGESEGQGLRIAIEKAIELNIPVLMAVRNDYITAWREFSGEFGIEIEPTKDAVLRWCGNVLGPERF